MGIHKRLVAESVGLHRAVALDLEEEHRSETGDCVQQRSGPNSVDEAAPLLPQRIHRGIGIEIA